MSSPNRMPTIGSGADTTSSTAIRVASMFRQRAVDPGGGPPHDSDMDDLTKRVIGLEAQMQNVATKAEVADVRTSLAEVEAHLSTKIDASFNALSTALAALPTKRDLTNWSLQQSIAALAVIAIIITGIIGGLGWLATVLAK